MVSEAYERILTGLKSIENAGILKDAGQVHALSEAIREYESLWQDTIVERVPVMLKVAVFKEDINSILMSAFAGGIERWCGDVSADGKLLGENMCEHIEKGGSLIFYDSCEGRDVVLTKGKMLQGIRMYAEKPVYGDIFEIVDHELRIDCGQVDELIADAIVQYALFTEILYAVEVDK